MARFSYRMQNVLNLKIQLEKQEKNRFGLVMRNLIDEQDKLDLLLVRKTEYEKEARRNLEGVYNLNRVRELKEAILLMDEYIEQQKLVIKKAMEAVEKQRARLNEALKERKIQDRLRERAYEVFLEEEKAAESLQIDELVSYRYGQKPDPD